MKTKLILSVIAVLFMLTACFGQETFHFEGESDNWQVEYVTDVKSSKDSENGTIKIRYIGENETPDQIYYSIKSGSTDMSGDASMEEEFLEMAGSNCSGCAVTKENDEFDVMMEWDGQSENFTLNNVN